MPVTGLSRFASGFAEQGPAIRAGLGLAVAGLGPSLARGLLPRSAIDQAMISGVLAGVRLGIGAFGHAVSQASAELFVARTGSGTPQRAQLLGAVTVAVVAGGGAQILPQEHDTRLPVLAARAAAQEIGRGAAASAVVVATDALTARIFHRRHDVAQLGAVAAVFGGITGVRMLRRHRRAERFYADDERPLGTIAAPMADANARRPVEVAKAAGTAAVATAGVLGLAATEYTIAQSVTLLLRTPETQPSLVLPVIAHGVSMTALGTMAWLAVDQIRRRVEHRSDVVEAAYRQPPESQYVSAGPASTVEFEHIGREGRRFVVMALDATTISEVMQEPAIDPVRVVAGYRSTPEVAERARLALNELERLGGFERSIIMVGAPTGIGYLNYVATEALEYLTRGDCATVVPQYSHSPSALSLDRVGDGVQLQTLVLRGIAARLSGTPAADRPRVLQFGESLGAMVALDIAANMGTGQFDDLGVDSGLYLGVPFLSRSWQNWKSAPVSFDPGRRLRLTAAGTDPVRHLPRGTHLMVVHDDDPVNKFTFDMIVRPPKWMGPAEERPPAVPRETKYRPVTTFLITLIDLKNGMQSRPGEFVRRGHDYRIDVRASMQEVFGLEATEDQQARIEAALREHEQKWSMSRLIAATFSTAANQTAAKLKSWGVPIEEDLFQQTAADLARGRRNSPPSG